MAEKVHKEYLGTKGRPEFRAMRQEFEYLHEKMAHIKSLVQEFDKAKINASKWLPQIELQNVLQETVEQS